MEGKEKIKKEDKIKIVKRKPKTKVMTDLKGNVIQPTKNVQESKKSKIKKHFNKYKKLYFLVASIVLLVILIMLTYSGIRSLVLNKKYGKYEKIMDNYGFSTIYNNKTAKSSEKVTRIEMVKMVLASIYNTEEVGSRGFEPQGEFDGDEWASLAKAFGIIRKEYITKENYDKPATELETLMTYLNARDSALDIPVSSTKESKFKNLQSYTEDERKYINDAAENGIIENNTKKIKLKDKIYKGELNKLVVTFVEKYNTIAPEGETLVLKEESKPSNAEIYPYILYSVDKEVYEYEPVYWSKQDYRTPLETYKHRKEYYPQVEHRAELIYNTILNVDYKTINNEKFSNTLKEFFRYDYSEEINAYVEHVKNNKITIEGKAEVQFPIFYLDGLRHRARVKLIFEIKNAETNKNILLGDLTNEDEITYKNKKYEIYVDVPMGPTLFSNSMFIDLEPVVQIMVNKEADSINEL